MDELIKVDEDFKILTDYYKKKLSKGNILTPLRLKKVSFNNKNRVFHIGIPGKVTAICVSILLIMAFYLSALRFNIYIWLMYIVSILIFLPFSFKIDKVTQIRFLAMTLACEARNLIERINRNNNTISLEDIDKIKNFLTEAKKYVYEPGIEKQLSILDTLENIIND